MFHLESHKAVREEILALPLIVQARFYRQLEKLRVNPTALRYALACGVENPIIKLY
ncbi:MULTISPECIES: hypothetical protein [Enterobacterales]|uniref:hypothetical protein n=1 Tax=Enterobacterales TaxID=91347 RepID=UPI002ED8C051